jgi:hypothetical protein
MDIERYEWPSVEDAQSNLVADSSGVYVETHLPYRMLVAGASVGVEILRLATESEGLQDRLARANELLAEARKFAKTMEVYEPALADALMRKIDHFRDPS